MNKQTVLDFSAFGITAGVIHFVKGIALSAAIAGTAGALAYLSNHPVDHQSVYAVVAVIFGTEALQGAWKWLKSVQDGVTVTTTTVTAGTEAVVSGEIA